MRYVDVDEPSSLGLKTYGEYDSAEFDIVKRYLRRGDAVLQIGAHSGFLTIALAQSVGSEGVVVAVENQPQLFAALAANVEPSGHANITIRSGFPFNNAESCAQGPMERNEAGRAAGARPKPVANKDDRTVYGDSSKSLLPAACRLVYVDARESAVVPLLSSWIQAVRPILFVGCNETEQAARLWFDLESQYDTYLAAAALFNPENYRGEVRNVFGAAQRAYLLFLPKNNEAPPVPPPHAASIWHITSVSELVIRHAQLPKVNGSVELGGGQQQDALLEIQAEQARRTLRESQLWDRLKNAEAELERLARVVRAKEEEISVKDRRVSLLESELRTMLASTTWQLTAPLRSFLDIFKNRR